MSPIIVGMITALSFCGAWFSALTFEWITNVGVHCLK